MIELLRERGQAIRDGNSGKIFLIEHKINTLKEEQYHANVAGVFMTFEDDKNVREAQNIMNETRLQIFG